ncbi:Ribose ABC transport system, ATP-binding protein RbsA (TC 3.A.1.2.1) [Olavius algarvensis spirochete endosymbiont]|uniref:sugar ABC transporter ATP-binding protein n=1 Tax=Olavius algarvensis spirochete endosymbiont TaxID=260710 RepID=UPI000F1FCAE0|nr:sugar ABC transporter ATP-binding protein [Olavius algarvensis spirochete endosymbiont]VDB00678.1 Ribose ABC transport system, ATP-binding protein RbsA (TC 3.A.1.2.1) [Olavius algarvensis spirochete endosymbiont]
MSEIILSMRDVHKHFMGVHALKGVDFELRNGEIHALVGENGAGKSTLMKVLTGIYERDSGEILLEGQLFHPHDPKQALRAGVGIIHQELNMMEHLTVAQNLFIGRESMHKGGLFLNDKAQVRRSRALFEHLNMNIDPSEILGRLTVGKQQMVEIAKAVSHSLKVLVLDEPTAALTETEIDELFTIMRDLASRGVAMIYISHRMDEIGRITDRVTVLRDGKYVGMNDTGSVTKEDIISMMVGRVIYEKPKASSNIPADSPVVLEVNNLMAGKMVEDVSFTLKRGEILGFAGLMGSGRTETARAIFGADEIQGGIIKIKGRSVRINSPMDAISHGIGYLSEDRKRFGLATELSVVENSLMASYEKYETGMFIHSKRIRKITSTYAKKLNIKTPSIDQLLKNLSGGNQQKVVISKWLINDADILIFDEPTRGIDVGTKSEVYTLMNRLVKQGKSIIMISSELPEVLRMSDRIVVMCEGKITGELDIQGASQEKIMGFATMRESI